MKTISLLISGLLISLLAGISPGPKDGLLNIGDKAPDADLKMEDAAGGNRLSLNDIRKDKGLLVIFTANTCPFCRAWESEYPELGKIAAENNIGMVLVNSNAALRDKEDSYAAMKEHYHQAGYNTPYVVDHDSELADAFGARTTPHVYLFNSKMELVYRGSIDDRYESDNRKPTKFYLKDAIGHLSKGEKINPAVTNEKGCSIKRVKA